MNPFKIDGQATIAFSGGRTSGMMLRLILDAHNDQLPDDVIVSFQNTGKEREETLIFVDEVSKRWNVPIVWLEYIPEKPYWFTSTFETAARNGEPFKKLIDKRGFLPNPVSRFCSTELKTRCLQRYIRDNFAWKKYGRIIGIRADEAHRARTLETRAKRDGYGTKYIKAPMMEAGLTKRDVYNFWEQQPFDLNLLNVNGSTPAGNCDLCFLKSFPTITGLMRDYPGLAEWWIEQERVPRPSKGLGGRFRKDRPTYAELQGFVNSQGDMFSQTDGNVFGVECEYFDTETEPCECHLD